jgi:hypothetical protein
LGNGVDAIKICDRMKILSLKEVEYMEIKDAVLKAMAEAGAPVSAGEVEKITGFDRKDIDKAFKDLKKEEKIVSPVRCKWEPAVK